MFRAASALFTACSRRSRRVGPHPARLFCCGPWRYAVCAACRGRSAAAVAQRSAGQRNRSLCSSPLPILPIRTGPSCRGPPCPRWTTTAESAPQLLTRAAYAEVILRNGQLVAWLRRNNPNMLLFFPPTSRNARTPRRASRTSSARVASRACTPAAIAECSSPPSMGSPSPRIRWRRVLMDAGFYQGRWACICADAAADCTREPAMPGESNKAQFWVRLSEGLSRLNQL